MTDYNEMDFIVRCMHVGNEMDEETGSIKKSITMAN